MSPTGARQDLQTIQQSVAAGSSFYKVRGLQRPEFLIVDGALGLEKQVGAHRPVPSRTPSPPRARGWTCRHEYVYGNRMTRKGYRSLINAQKSASSEKPK